METTEGGSLVYLASPKGRQPPTPFALKSVTADGVVFENTEHDFPQRIIYQRGPEGGLTMRIEGLENGREKTMQWDMDVAERH